MSGIEIRPVRRADLPLLDEHLPRPRAETHPVRLARQEAGEGIYLVAVEGAEPVGHVLIRWNGCDDDPVRAAFGPETCPDLEDLVVRADRRGRGVGARLLDRAEALAAERGFSRIGLGVGVENDVAAGIYLRRGYVESGVGRYTIGDRGVRADGTPFSWEETCVYLVKRLGTPPPEGPPV